MWTYNYNDTYFISDELYHYGIMGMRWGHRKEPIGMRIGNAVGRAVGNYLVGSKPQKVYKPSISTRVRRGIGERMIGSKPGSHRYTGARKAVFKLGHKIAGRPIIRASKPTHIFNNRINKYNTSLVDKILKRATVVKVDTTSSRFKRLSKSYSVTKFLGMNKYISSAKIQMQNKRSDMTRSVLRKGLGYAQKMLE